MLARTPAAGAVCIFSHTRPRNNCWGKLDLTLSLAPTTNETNTHTHTHTHNHRRKQRRGHRRTTERHGGTTPQNTSTQCGNSTRGDNRLWHLDAPIRHSLRTVPGRLVSTKMWGKLFRAILLISKSTRHPCVKLRTFPTRDLLRAC